MANELVIIIYGLSAGAIYAIVVLGLVLTYRVSKFLNLAHGAMGMLVTYVFWQFAVGWGWPLWLSVALALGVVAPIVGVVTGGILFRGLLGRDDASKIAGSVVLILVLHELVSRIWSGSAKQLPSLMPEGSIAVGDAYVSWDQIIPIFLALGIAGVMAVGLAKTGIGTQIRAVAENRALAAGYGVNVTRVEAMGWAFATVLGATAGMLIAPLSALTPLGLTFLVVYGLSAAAVGRLTSVTGALLGAVTLGIAQSEATRLPASIVEKISSLPSAMPFLLLVVALGVMLRAGIDVGGGESDQTAGKQSAGERPRATGTLHFSQAFRRAQLRGDGMNARAIAVWVFGAMASIGIAVLVGGALDASWLFLVTSAAIWTVVFASIGLLNGLGRQVSLCQASFMGIGALVAARFQSECVSGAATGQLCQPLDSPLRAWVAPLVAALVAGIVGVIIAIGASRVRGVMLAVVTLSFGFFLDNTIFPARDISGGEFGFPVQRPSGFTSSVGFWVLCAVVAALAVFLVRNLSRSATGRVMRGIEQAPPAIAAFGYEPWAYKLGIFGVSAAMAGLAGYLYSALIADFHGNNYTTFLSLFLFVVVSIVGTHTALSPVVAAAFYVLVPKLLSTWGGGSADANLVYALGALATLSLPGGVLGWISLRRSKRHRGTDQESMPPAWLVNSDRSRTGATRDI